MPETIDAGSAHRLECDFPVVSGSAAEGVVVGVVAAGPGFGPYSLLTAFTMLSQSMLKGEVVVLVVVASVVVEVGVVDSLT